MHPLSHEALFSRSPQANKTGRSAFVPWPNVHAHQQSLAETRLYDPCREEPARTVERLGVRVADDVQHGRALATCEIRAMPDQTPAYSLPLQVGFHEQAVQLDVPVSSQQHGRESGNRPVAFGHEDMARRDLLHGKYDSIGVRDYRFAIARIAQRCPKLQRFKRLALASEGQSDRQRNLLRRCRLRGRTQG